MGMDVADVEMRMANSLREARRVAFPRQNIHIIHFVQEMCVFPSRQSPAT